MNCPLFVIKASFLCRLLQTSEDQFLDATFYADSTARGRFEVSSIYLPIYTGDFCCDFSGDFAAIWRRVKYWRFLGDLNRQKLTRTV